MMVKITNAQIAFLKKVQQGEVRLINGYSPRRGGYFKFIGGEATTRHMQTLGLVRMEGVASLGRPSYAVLTEAGLAAIASANMEAGS